MTFPSFGKLPEELLQQVCEYFSTEDLQTLMAVDTRFYMAVIIHILSRNNDPKAVKICDSIIANWLGANHYAVNPVFIKETLQKIITAPEKPFNLRYKTLLKINQTLDSQPLQIPVPLWEELVKLLSVPSEFTFEYALETLKLFVPFLEKTHIDNLYKQVKAKCSKNDIYSLRDALRICACVAVRFTADQCTELQEELRNTLSKSKQNFLCFEYKKTIVKLLGTLIPGLPGSSCTILLRFLLENVDETNANRYQSLIKQLIAKLPEPDFVKFKEKLIKEIKQPTDKLAIVYTLLVFFIDRVPNKEYKDFSNHLQAGLRHQDQKIQKAAAQTLARLIPELESEVCKQVLHALFDAIAKEDKDTARREKFDALGILIARLDDPECGNIFTSQLEKLKDGNAFFVQADAIRTLYLMLPRLNTLQVYELKIVLMKKITHGYPCVEYSALEALNSMAHILTDPDKSQLLEECKAKSLSKHLNIRDMACKLLGNLGKESPEAVKKDIRYLLLAQFTLSRDAREALCLLPPASHPVFWEALINKRNSNNDWRMGKLIFDTLWFLLSDEPLNEAEIRDYLLNQLINEEMPFRLVALEILQIWISCTPNFENGITIYSKHLAKSLCDTSSCVRVQAVRAYSALIPKLSLNEKDDLLQILMEVLINDEWTVRQAATEVLELLLPDLAEGQQIILAEFLSDRLLGESAEKNSDVFKSLLQVSDHLIPYLFKNQSSQQQLSSMIYKIGGLLNDENRDIRAHALQILCRLLCCYNYQIDNASQIKPKVGGKSYQPVFFVKEKVPPTADWFTMRVRETDEEYTVQIQKMMSAREENLPLEALMLNYFMDIQHKMKALKVQNPSSEDLITCPGTPNDLNAIR